MPNEKNRRKPNGHAEPQNRTNGHGAVSTEPAGIAVHGNLAGAENASGASAFVPAAISANAAGRNGLAQTASGMNSSSPDTDEKIVCFPGPTDSEAMQDAGAYVSAVAERVDLVSASVRLVQSRDEKIAKSELDRLREMKFGKVGPAFVDEVTRVDFGDLPRPQR